MDQKETKSEISADDFYKSIAENQDVSSSLSAFATLAENFNCKTSDYDIVKNYLHVSGNCKEMLLLVKGISDSDSQVAMLIMKTLCHILIRTASDLQAFVSVGTSIVNEILAYGMKTVYTFLKIKQKSSRTKLALHLLASMVALGGQTAHQVVSKLNFSNVTFTHLLNRKNFSEEEDTRTAFINLIIIIMSTCDNTVIRQLVEIKGFLNDIFPGLVSDRPHIITLVLSTFKKLIVENPVISKTTKLRLFNDYSLKPVLRLYLWKGPIRDKAHRKRKLGEQDISIAYEASEEEINSVQSAAHEFMQSLCCSFKTGIIFHDSSCGTSGKNLNHVLTIILKYIPKPHTNKLVSEFVISVLKTCPDQMAFYLPNLKESCTPRVSLLWVDAMNIIKKIILVQDPISCLFKQGEKKPVSTLVNITKSLCYPNVITPSEISDAFEDGKPFICYHLCDFLISILIKVKSILEFCVQADFSKTPYSSADVSTFRQAVLTTLIQNFTFMKDVEQFWKKLTSSPEASKETNDTDLPDPLLSSQLFRILELIQHFVYMARLAYHDYDVNVPKLFQNLKNCHASLSSEEICNLNIKLVDIISTQGEEVIKLWNENIIDSPLMVLLDVYLTSPSENMIEDVSKILKKVLIHTKVFEYCPWEIDVWLESIKESKTKHFPYIIEFINSSMCTLLQNPTVFSDDIIANTFEKATSHMSLDVTAILNDLLSTEKDPILLEYFEESSSISSTPKQCFSSLVPAALSTLKSVENHKKKSCRAFLEKALSHIMYHQQSREVLFSLILKYKENISSNLCNYFELLCPHKFEEKEKLPVKEDLPVMCSADLSDHLKAKFLTLHNLASSLKGCSCDIQCEPDQLDYNYQEKLIWQIMTYLDWEITLLLENKIENTDTEKYMNLLEIILISLHSKKISSDDRMEISGTEYVDNKSAKCDILEDIFSQSSILNLFLWVDKVPKSKRRLLKNCVNCATKLIFSLIEICDEKYYKYLTGFKNKVVKYNSFYFQTGNCLKGSVMYEDSDICDVISRFSVLFCVKDVTYMLEELLNLKIEDVKLENHFPALLLLLKMYVDSKEYIPLSPKAMNSLSIKYAHLSKKQKKTVSGYIVFMFENHPDLTSTVSPDSCHLLLKQSGSKNFLGCIIDYNQDLRKLIQLSIIENLEEFKSSSDFLYLVPKCIQHSTVNEELDKNFLERISLLYWEAVSNYLLTDTASPNKLLENSSTCRAIQVLFQQKILAVKKLSKFLKNNEDALYAAVPHSSNMLIFLELLDVMKNHILERNKSAASILKLTLHWITNAVSSIPNSSEFSYFPLLKFTNSLLQDIAEADMGSLVDSNVFFPQILKVAMKHTDIGIELIAILAALCKKSKNFNLPTQSVFDLVTGHSHFFNIMLSHVKEDEELKECIIDLLITLVSTDKSVCKDNHLGLILSSYTGSLKSVDLKLLYLIKLYSESDVDMVKFSPFLWSETAVVHYSVVNSETTHLWKRPKLQDLLSIFLPEMIEATVKRYPLTLKLEPFIPDSKELENCSQLDKVYDLRFLLPVFANVLSPGSYVHCQSFMDSKVLMLVFTSLSSFDADTRALGYYCLTQLYFHLEGANYREREIWLSLLDSLRNSITSENPRLPSIVSLFLARVTQVFTKPDHPLFSVLYKFIMVKPNLDISQVPEFYKLFNSIETDHRLQRMWLLKLLTDGLRSSLDFHICEKRYIFSLLFTHYWSSVSSLEEKVAVLDTISSAVKIDSSARVLCQNSLLSWLHNVVRETDMTNVAILQSLSTLFRNLWLTTRKCCVPKLSEEDIANTSENNDAKTKTFYISFCNEFQLVLLSFLNKTKTHADIDEFQPILELLASEKKMETKDLIMQLKQEGCLS